MRVGLSTSPFILVAALLVAPAPSLAITLADELRRIVDDNPQIKAEDERVGATDAEVDAAFSGFLPQLVLDGDIGHEVTNSRIRREVQGTDARFTRKFGAFSLNQFIYDGDRTNSTVDAARHRRSAAEAGRLSTTEEVLFEGTQAYLNVLRQQKQLEIALRNEASIRRQLQLEDERVQRGAGIEVDVLLAKSRLQIAREQRVGIEGLLRQAVSVYKQVFGIEPQIGLLDEVDLPLDLEPETLEDALSLAFDENPNIEQIDRLIDVAQQERDIAASTYYPDIDLVGEARLEDDFDGTSGLTTQGSILVRGTWELFNGFETRSRVRAAVREKAALSEEADQIDREVEEAVRIAWEGVKTGRERIELLENAVTIAQLVFEDRQKLRAAGRETALNVLDAETEVFTARLKLIDAQTDTKISFYQLLLAMGILTPEVLNL
ncbi:MAG: TolC family protein [Alphaproteobacteria bacterium]|nr:TolC family protein [Alphaproteobacteria bacterium]